mmetsp:Transcript_118443/g.330405  ORF Transcript_118443/g.330405 Transcript_118443/m.330405 type:complete len:207 (+) Transcript_118443:424-1044(+)
MANARGNWGPPAADRIAMATEVTVHAPSAARKTRPPLPPLEQYAAVKKPHTPTMRQATIMVSTVCLLSPWALPSSVVQNQKSLPTATQAQSTPNRVVRCRSPGAHKRVTPLADGSPSSNRGSSSWATARRASSAVLPLHAQMPLSASCARLRCPEWSRCTGLSGTHCQAARSATDGAASPRTKARHVPGARGRLHERPTARRAPAA